jgi:hypothetical protein
LADACPLKKDGKGTFFNSPRAFARELLDAQLYDFKVTEGSKAVGETVASINIRRVDKEEFSDQELEELKTYLNEKFPGNVYKRSFRDGHGNEMGESPTNTVIVWITPTKDEHRRRAKNVEGVRVVIPASEIREKLEGSKPKAPD